MPASAGRVRMPHNNRMQASAALKTTAIWQKTIGHDPYAGKDDPGKPSQEDDEKAKEKARQILNVARQQNLTDGANRDDFARKLYLGLKDGKKRRETETSGVVDNSQLQYEAPTSSSEDEFVEVQTSSKTRKKKHHKKRKRKSRHYASGESESPSSSSDDESDSDDSSRKHRKRKRSKKRSRHHRRRRDHDDSSDDSSSSTSDESSVHRKKRRRKKGEKKKKSIRKRDKKYRRADASATKETTTPEPAYIASEKYEGTRTGFVFKMGDQGLGYYRDKMR